MHNPRTLFLHHEQRRMYWDEPGYVELYHPMVSSNLLGEVRSYPYQRFIRKINSDYNSNSSSLVDSTKYFHVITEELEHLFSEFRPDLVVYSLTWPSETIPIDVFRALKQKFSFKLFSVIWDHDENNKQLMEYDRGVISVSDLVSIADSHFRTERIRNKVGPYKSFNNVHTVQFIPMLADPAIFYSTPEKTYDVTLSGSSEGERIAIYSELQTAGIQVNRIGGLLSTDKFLPLSEYAKQLSQSLIVVNTQTCPERIQLKGRVMQVLSCGSLLLEQWSIESEKFLQALGLEELLWKDSKELIQKIQYWLSRRNQLSKFADMAKNKYLALHNPVTWTQRIFHGTGIIRNKNLLEITSADSNLDRLYESGNLVTLVESSNVQSTWHRLGSSLLGRNIDDLSMASNTENSASDAFAKGTIAWLCGDDKTAILHFKGCPNNPHANNMVTLISKEKIQVLSQLDRGSWSCILDAIENDPKFEVSNIGFRNGDTLNQITESIHSYYSSESVPDFFITKMLEWHILPPDLAELQCPKFAQTADYDIHIQSIYPYLAQFDEVIIEQEWSEMSKLVKGNVVTCPKAYPLLLDAYKYDPNNGDRHIDVFMSGTTLHPYHPDKSTLLNRIISIKGIKTQVYDGFLNTNEYLKLLSQSKICITYIRRPGMPTRGLEALALGCAVLIESNSSLALYYGPSDGVFTYNETNIEQVIHEILHNWNDVQERLKRTSARVRSEFHPKTIASHYFRFLTFLAAKPRNNEKAINHQPHSPKRLVFHKGWLEHPLVYKRLRDLAQQKLKNHLSIGTQNASHYINSARELVLEYATGAIPEVASDFSTRFGIIVNKEAHLLEAAISIYQEGIAVFPDSLVLRFNLIRTALLFGNRNLVRETIIQTQEIISQSLSKWKIDPLDDVFPWDFFESLFNYRRYFDIATMQLKGDLSESQEPVRLILASMHYLLSFFTDERDNAKLAVQLDAEFPFYSFRYAQVLLSDSHIQNQHLCYNTLLSLSHKSMLSKQACNLALQGKAENHVISSNLRVFEERATELQDRIREGTKPSTQEYYPDVLRNFHGLNSQMQIAPHTDISQNCVTPKLKVLYIPLEFSTWQNAKYWSYSISWGIEDALLTEGVDCFTIPCMRDVPPEDPTAWLHYLVDLCSGKTFDQIWFTANHAPLNDELLNWIQKSAPIRIGLFCESLAITEDEWIKNPTACQKRQSIVDRSISVITHAIVVDEGDIQTMEAQSIPTFWLPPCVNAESICSRIPETPISRQAVFYGAIYGKRQSFLEHPTLQNFLVRPEQSLEEQTELPGAYDKLQLTFRELLLNPEMRTESLFRQYMDLHRTLRKSCYRLWIKTLAEAPIVVNLPQYGFMYSGRIAEAMASGRPVISWEIPNRPLTQKLFEQGKEILLFDQNQPNQLVAKIQDLLTNPAKAAQIAIDAKKRLIENYTTENQVQMILKWCTTSKEATVTTHTATQSATKAIPIVFDIGANVGAKAKGFLDDGYRVVCVEPQPEMIKALHQTFDGNPKVSIVGKALADKPGSLTMSICSAAPTISTFSEEWKQGRFSEYSWDKKVDVPVTTLDTLISEFGVPAYCKIDVEGFEFEVISGLNQTIPLLSFEFTKEFIGRAKQCIAHLHALGFQEFNFKIAESDSYAINTWANPNELFSTIANIKDDLLWGDIYARHTTQQAKTPKLMQQPPVRLHLGCGEQYLEDYTNIDYPGTEHSVMNVKADEYADITILQYAPNSVDEIRLHHVFEHFQRTTALGLLIRWHEWLKPGGKLVIETPDLEGSAKIFLSNQPWEIKAATVRHLAGDHSDKWAIHVDHWSSERFQHTLKALGFADVQTTASNWAHPPYLANVTAVATKGKNLTRDELLLAADSILWESTVSPVEQKSYQIWRGQLRSFLSPQPPKSQPVESKYTLEEIHNFNQRSRDRWIAQRAIQVPTGASVLDVGAGTCPYRSLFRHCNYKTHDFKKYTGEKLGGTNQYGEIDYVSEITAIPVENQTFDVILCTEVLEHVPEPGLAIQEMARILKPGGRLILSAPLGSGLHQLPFHYYGGFSPEWYRYHAKKLGLSVVEISPNGGFFRQLAQECHRAAGMIASLPQAADFRSPETLKLLAETLPQQFFAIEDSVLVDQFTVGYHVELKKP